MSDSSRPREPQPTRLLCPWDFPGKSTGVSAREQESKAVNPEYSLERLMLKLKLQYSEHLMRRADLLEKTLMLGKIFEGISSKAMEKDMETHSSSLAKRILWTEEPGGLLSLGSHRVGHD